MESPSTVGTSRARAKEVELLGFRVPILPRQEILSLLCARIENRQATHLVTLNTEMIISSDREEGVRQTLLLGDVFVADGVGLVGAAWLLRRPKVHRYPGVDLAYDLMSWLAERQGSVYLLGAEPGVAEEAAGKLARELPGLKIAGQHDGYFSEENEGEIVKLVREAAPDLLLVGMGSPKQESFIARHRAELDVPLMIGVGGALEVFSGRKQRAPRAMQRMGLEWLYRTLQDLSRIGRLGKLWSFMGLVLREAFGRKTE